MPNEIVVDGNGALTFLNLLDNISLFRWGIAGDIAVVVMKTLLTVMLYQLFKSVSATGLAVAISNWLVFSYALS